MGMEIGKYITEFDGPGQNAFLGQKASSFIDHGFHVLTMDEFQHQVRTIVFGEIIINPGN